MKRSLTPIVTLLFALAAAPALAQSNIDAANKFAWQENCGWLNWRDAGSPTIAGQGAFIGPTFLAGFVWGENIGWINLGDGTPANGVSYANTTGADSGVNRDPVTGNLSGLAWGENSGWINFSGGALATPPQPARFDSAARRLRGFAWGENIGWVNLDDAAHFVRTNCPADFNNSGAVTSQDIFDFLAAFFTPGSLAADFNHNGAVTPQDIFDFLAAFFTPCP